MEKQIQLRKAKERVIIPSRREVVLKRIADMQAEIGRLNKLLDEMRADVLHLLVDN